ncbi:DoxX family protein [Pseudopedobacter saltans DSM 12145]|uniref:DoxX family protein n=1 Tax=Pseudopedobacter saltans (strain ATCC 51119 / DSM 12145 / JCM 21818 / CCUG 39354 / LMG 10337 / NBRC 100064 / NCIMB 13643) TaxID=762903 RepID=F0S5N3_PSESL|nr:BT_3928 family protein [Pseudopedobacter saltans]ADY54207.1 DoxX family protein [Pseudopedobacter saltans DSM 12145]
MVSNKTTSTTLLWIVRIFVGLLFIFSGLIKLNDPLGFSYKLEEYFEVFHMTFLSPFAVFFSIAICTLEVFLGVLVLTGIAKKTVNVGLIVLILFFTFLTFYSAAFDVVKSCGCFGDAIPLTPWQSFGKDLILLILILYIFFNQNKINACTNNKSAKNIFIWAALLVPLAFGLYTYNTLPIIDFLPYKEGVNIPEAMKIPEGAPKDEYEIIYTLKNKNTGEEKKMNDKEYLATKIYEDPNWEFISSSDPKLIKAGYQPKIKDLNIFDSQGVSFTEEIIENPYYNLIAVAWKLDNSDLEALKKINLIALNAANNYRTRSVLLTSNSAQDAENLSKDEKLLLEVFYADAVPLKSMVRSNPGLILMKNGVVIKKWPASRLPDYEELERTYFSKN